MEERMKEQIEETVETTEEKQEEQPKAIEENSNEQNNQPTIQTNTGPSWYKILSFIGFIGVISSIFKGCHKMFVYVNYESDYLSDENVNAYVGGDAYNYIINGTYATSYFVLALMFMVFACTMLILNKMDINK